MDNQATSKVQSTQLGQEATAPYPMSHWVINQYSPQQHENGEGLELHSLSKGTSNQGWSQCGKHTLEGYKGQLWNSATLQNFHANAG